MTYEMDRATVGESQALPPTGSGLIPLHPLTCVPYLRRGPQHAPASCLALYLLPCRRGSVPRMLPGTVSPLGPLHVGEPFAEVGGGGGAGGGGREGR
jgi:hypothetical protein